jgi:hypothetical protein
MLLVVQQRKVRVEQAMSRVALALLRQLQQVDSISGNAYPVTAPSVPRSVSKSRNNPPFPQRIEVWRSAPSDSHLRKAELCSAPANPRA